MSTASREMAFRLMQEIEEVNYASFTNEDRKLVLDAARALVGRLSSGWDTTWRKTVADPTELATIRAFVLLNPLQAWEAADWVPKTATELAKLCEQRVDVTLIGCLSASRLLFKVKDKYSPGPYCWVKDLANDMLLRGCYIGFVDWTGDLFLNLPHFLRDSGFRDPVDGTAANYQHLHRVDGSQIYLQLERQPSIREGVQDFMDANTKHTLKPWMTIFPLEAFVHDIQRGQVLVVDIGGGKGQDLRLVAQEFPDLPENSLILEDLPGVVNSKAGTSEHHSIRKIAYDYYEPQPVVGARFYYMKNVMHNLSTDKAILVLRNQAAAMTQSSRLLVYERFKSVQNKPGTPEALDFNSIIPQDVFMMGMFSSQERDEQQYRNLLRDAGFQVVEVHGVKGVEGRECAYTSHDRIIEAVLAEHI
ncbi:S-adenosyl-L-methionine-dependent methyltransferase [Teratosphaeria destructans]|uniref:S-adenosyl-L-methionine-dependent methyltransferase n=1 Tax=Teratosphaeria destructans TaxID=418781 RepID=A0A9W7W2C6_9PEZI|nr:S-adenosyl-L-methionine-dependent methyltransferase [Teratosphaeria destructans]